MPEYHGYKLGLTSCNVLRHSRGRLWRQRNCAWQAVPGVGQSASPIGDLIDIDTLKSFSWMCLVVRL